MASREDWDWLSLSICGLVRQSAHSFCLQLKMNFNLFCVSPRTSNNTSEIIIIVFVSSLIYHVPGTVPGPLHLLIQS